MKFQLLPGSRPILEKSAIFAKMRPDERHQVTTYFDTPDRLLNREKFSLRVRREEDRRVQTVKSESSHSGIAADRSEWEWEINQDEPDLSVFVKIAKLAALRPGIEGRLEPAFVTHIDRTTRRFQSEDGTVIEIAIDEGDIAASHGAEPVCELELELKAGAVGPMYGLAAQIQSLAPMWLLTQSKAARGWHLRDGTADRARKAVLPSLHRDLRPADALRVVLREALGHLIANIGPTLRDDAEGLHQLRAALRRIRAAIDLFKPLLDAPSVDDFSRRLGHVGRILGLARDWDVFCLETLPCATTALPLSVFDGLAEAASLERLVAHADVRATLRDPPFTALILDLTKWLETVVIPPVLVRGEKPADDRLGGLAPALLDRVQDKAIKRGRGFRHLSAEHLHDLRKAMKKLAFDGDCFSGLYDPASAGTYHELCGTVLKGLGNANDAVATQRLAKALLRRNPAGFASPVDALSHWTNHRRHKALDGIERTMKRFLNAPRFWHPEHRPPSPSTKLGVIHLTD
ncbi:CYTH and CHAD domain-containing protein [Acidisoma cladoniae]|uniref:CYTH and CHAD domain-containing protein n=1 Tax=Acidisoma cladoniae TaxID=3040935 RepID=UPI00254C1F61|nr:CYTH and CHAD domain-containing protein [Acidisoma sp. PAMC 29798]